MAEVRKFKRQGTNNEKGYTYKGRVGEAVETVKSTVGGLYEAAKGKVEEYQEKRRANEEIEETKRQFEEKEARRDKYRTKSDYMMEARLEREIENDDGSEASHKKIEKLLHGMQAREDQLDDTAYAKERIKARDQATKEMLEGQKARDQARSQSSSGGSSFAPSDMFGVGSYGGGSDMFGVGGGGMDPGMFSVGSPSSGSEPVRQPRKRAAGRAPRGSQPSGYDGYYDMFGVGGMGRAGGADMFGIGGPSEPRRGRKVGRGNVGNPLAPSDIFAPANVFGIGRGGSGGVHNPFGGGSSKKVSNPFGGGGNGGDMFGFGGGSVGNPFGSSAPRRTTKRKAAKRKTKKRRR